MSSGKHNSPIPLPPTCLFLQRKVAREAAAAQEAALNPEAAIAQGDGTDVEKMAAMEGADKREGGHTNWDGTVSHKEGNYYQVCPVTYGEITSGKLSLRMT
jgi:hypothetical protein